MPTPHANALRRSEQALLRVCFAIRSLRICTIHLSETKWVRGRDVGCQLHRVHLAIRHEPRASEYLVAGGATCRDHWRSNLRRRSRKRAAKVLSAEVAVIIFMSDRNG